MDKSKDFDFRNITELKWLPYVGNEYFKSNYKVMIIGESHYQKDSKESIKRNNTITFTREILKDKGIAKDYKETKIFQNLYKALFRTDNIDTTALWKKLVFYNFVQHPMITNLKRPSKINFIGGWKAYFKLIEITKPDFCVFIGVKSSETISEGIKGTGYLIVSEKKYQKINGTFPREVIIKKDNDEIKLLFIKHTSQYFSWNNWNKYLKQNYETQVNWIKSGIWN
jgi:hypothetical protein